MLSMDKFLRDWLLDLLTILIIYHYDTQTQLKQMATRIAMLTVDF